MMRTSKYFKYGYNAKFDACSDQTEYASRGYGSVWNCIKVSSLTVKHSSKTFVFNLLVSLALES